MNDFPQGVIVGIAAVGIISTTAWLMSFALRRRPAVQHWLLLSALLCTLATPILVIGYGACGMSSFQLPLLASETPEVATASRERVPDFEREVESPIDSQDNPAVSDPPQRALESDRLSDESTEPTAGGEVLTTTIVTPSDTNDAKPIQSESPPIGVIGWLLAVWIGGVILLTAGFLRGWLRLQWMLGRSRPADERSVGDVASDVQRQLNCSHFPPMMLSDEASTPMAAGLFRPSIVLPAGLTGMIDRDQLRDVLAHEAAHILRRDHLVVLCQIVARIVFWPIVTIHLLNRALAQAREEVCDNYVLADRDAIGYGETLLRLAQLSRGRSSVAASMGILHWRGRLETRITGLIDNRRSPMTRPGRFATLFVILLLVSVTAAVCGAQLVSSPRKTATETEAKSEPTQKERDAETVRKLIAGLKETEAAIKNFSVTTNYVKLQLVGLPVKKPVRTTLVTKSIVTFDGKAANETVGQGINIEPNGKDTRLFNTRSRGVFDGKVARNMTVSGNNDFSFGAIADYPNWHWVDPREFTTHYIRKPVSQQLITRGAKFLKRGTWDKRPVVVVDTTPVKNRSSYMFRFWIDPERKIVVRRAMLIQHKPGQKFQEYTRIESRDHKQVAPGVWLPGRMKSESVGVTAELKPERLMLSYTGTNTEWKVNRKLPAGTFTLVFPENVFVNDHRIKTLRKRHEDRAKKTTSAVDKALNRLLARIEKGPKPPPGAKTKRHTKDSRGRIVNLNLRGVTLTQPEFALIARMPYLVSLDLSGTKIEDRNLAHLKNLVNLRRLNLWNTPITGAGLAHLRPLTLLERLDVGDTQIDSAALRHLVGLQRLTHLTLARNRRITDTAFAHIVKLKNLESLKIGETMVSNAGLKHIKAMNRLRGLTLDNTKVTEEGLNDLATNRRFKWMATPKATAKELARLMERGFFSSVQNMLSFGLRLPSRGTFRAPILIEIPRTARDRKLGRHRFRLEMHWVVKKEKINDLFYAAFSVNRGAIIVQAMGIVK